MYDNNLTNRESKRYRKKFTTMLDPELSAQLRKIAIDKKVSAADIIEKLVKAYLLENKKSLPLTK